MAVFAGAVGFVVILFAGRTAGVNMTVVILRLVKWLTFDLSADYAEFWIVIGSILPVMSVCLSFRCAAMAGFGIGAGGILPVVTSGTAF